MTKLKIGMAVEINPRSDRSRKLRVQGTVSEILTKAEHHPHGLLVKLEDGEVGRVKNIVDQEFSTETETVTTPSPNVTPAPNLQQLIVEGENHHVEFKAQALWSAKFTNEDIKNHRPQSGELRKYGKNTSRYIISKTLAGFLNTDGGTLVIGVNENKKTLTDEIIGVELEYGALKDPSPDGYRRMIVDVVKDYLPSNIFNHLNKFIQIHFGEIDGHTVCGVSVSKSDKKVFIKLQGTDHFFIRVDATTRELTGEEVVDYCQNRFR